MPKGMAVIGEGVSTAHFISASSAVDFGLASRCKSIAIKSGRSQLEK